jgi:hypothetical protein
MRAWRRLTLIAILGVMCGCTSINSTSFHNMSSAYRDAVEGYSNDNILLNIVRASKNMPMSFLDIPSVIGTGNVVTEASVATAQTSAGTAAVSSTTGGSLGISVNNGFTFTQASLDNAQFLQSFLKEIPLGVLGLKGTERLLPRAVTYTLLLEGIELRSNNTLVQRFNNDPIDPNYEQFQQLLYLLIESGLTVENAPIKTPIGPPLEKAILTKSLEALGPTTIDHIAKGTLSLDKTSVKGSEAYQLMRVEMKPRVCVNQFRAEELMGNLLSKSSYCLDSPRHRKSEQHYTQIIQAFKSSYVGMKNMELVIGIRSPGNVFDFLGSVLNTQFEGDGSKMVMIHPTKSVLDSYNDRYKKSHPLFKVYRDTKDPKAAATVAYRGVTYSIADDDDSYTKEVIEFMSTLVTIAKIPGAIPATPAVVVR